MGKDHGGCPNDGGYLDDQGCSLRFQVTSSFASVSFSCAFHQGMRSCSYPSAFDLRDSDMLCTRNVDPEYAIFIFFGVNTGGNVGMTSAVLSPD